MPPFTQQSISELCLPKPAIGREGLMKYLMISLVGVCLLIATVPAAADQAEDEAAIRDAYKQALAAYNNRDFKVFAVLHVEAFENWDGTSKGRASLEKLTLPESLEAKLLDEIGIVFVTPDVAIYKYRLEMTGDVDADGKPLPPTKRLSARVFVKKDGKWLHAAAFARTIEE